MKLLNQVIFLLLTSILFGSCSLFAPAEEKEVLTIEDEFKLELKEDLSVNGSQLKIKFSTLAEINCDESFIAFDYTEDNNQIDFNITDIVFPQDCASIPTIATGSSIHNITQNEYDVEVSLKSDIRNEGKLYADANSYELIMATQDGIKISYPKLQKIPRGTIWGSISVKEDQLVEDYKIQFENYFLSNFTTAFLSQGMYSFFEIDEDSNVLIDGEASSESKFVFTYSFEGITDDIITKVKSFQMQNPEIELHFFTYDGKSNFSPKSSHKTL